MYRKSSGLPATSFRHMTNYELLRGIYIATAISPVSLLSMTLITSDSKSRITLSSLAEVSFLFLTEYTVKVKKEIVGV